jgi:hypothetical protein
LTRATVADLPAKLAKLWAGTIDNMVNETTDNMVNETTGNITAQTTENMASAPAVLPPLPPALVPLPPGAVGSGTLHKPCRCGSTQYVEMPIPEGRTRRDCRKCGRFLDWGKWYDQGGPTP